MTELGLVNILNEPSTDPQCKELGELAVTRRGLIEITDESGCLKKDGKT